MTTLPSLLTRSLTNFIESLAVAIPRLLSGLVFLALAYATVRIVPHARPVFDRSDIRR